MGKGEGGSARGKTAGAKKKTAPGGKSAKARKGAPAEAKAAKAEVPAAPVKAEKPRKGAGRVGAGSTAAQAPAPAAKKAAKSAKSRKALAEAPPEVPPMELGESHAEAAARAEVDAALGYLEGDGAELPSEGAREPARASDGASAHDDLADRDLEAEVLPPEVPEEPSPSDPLEAMGEARPSGLASALVLARQVAGAALQGGGTLGRVFGAARGLAKAVTTGLGASGSREVDEYGKDPELTLALSPISDFLYERYWRVSVEGAFQLPRGPAIVVANHSGALPFDGPILSQALLRERPDLPEARWLMEDQIFYAPFFGTVFNRLGAVRACPENALRLLSEGRPVIVFPEGAQGTGKPFSERYQLKRLGRGGFAKLAVRAGVPIVPAAVVGAEEALPLLGKIPARALGLPDLPITPGPLPAKWSIRFGEPIDTAALGAGAAEDFKTIQSLVERTREEIEGMLRTLLSERRSVFGG